MRSLLSRRELLHTLTAAAGIGLVVACGPAVPSASPTVPAASAPTVAPAQQLAPKPAAPTAGQSGAPQATAGSTSKNGRLVFGSPRQLYEGNNFARSADPITQASYESLLGVDMANGKFIPQLAEKYQVEPNQKDWRFFIRKGVQFHNNLGELTADDVVFTFDQVTAPGETNSAIAQELRDIIDHWEVVNPYELVLVAKVPDATLPFFVSQAVQSGIMSKRDFTARGGTPIPLADISQPLLAGTAPWQYKSRAQNQNVIFERVPYKHWRVEPDFQALEVRIQAEVASRLGSLLSGETNMTLLTRDTRNTALQRGMRVLQGQLLNTPVFVAFMGSYANNPDDPSSGYKYPNSPVMNVKVRKALSKALHRDELNKLFQNEGSPMYVRFHEEVADGSGWSLDWKARFKDEYDYDPAGAKQLLADAGFGPSKPLKMVVELTNGAPQLPEQDDLLEAIAQMWQAVGVQAELETLDRSQYISKQRQLGFDTHVWLFGQGQPQNWVLNRVLTAHRQNRGNGFENYEFETAFLSMIKTLDEGARAEQWKQVGDIDFDLHSAIPLFWLKQEVIADPKVVASFEYPGNLIYPFTLLWNVKAA